MEDAGKLMHLERKTKILFLIHDLGHGGAEKVLVNLVNRMDKIKFDITVMALFGGGVNEKYLCKEVTYRAVFKRAIPGNSRLIKHLSPALLHRLFIRETYDIEVGYLEGPAVRIISGCGNAETKLVAWEHSLPHTKVQFGGLYKSYEDSVKVYACYDSVVCVSESVKDGFCKVYPQLPVPAVLYNVIETDSIATKAQEDVKDVTFDDAKFKIVGVGKIQPLKGFDKLARVHKLLIENGCPVHTYVLGEGSQQSEIEEYLKENALSDTFTFLGYRENPYKYMSKCDLYVCPSHAEGFSTAAIEALLVGLPVVTTPVSGMEEMLGTHGECGIITDGSEIELCAAVEYRMQDEGTRSALKQHARERASRFTPEKTVKETERFFVSSVYGGNENEE